MDVRVLCIVGEPGSSRKPQGLQFLFREIGGLHVFGSRFVDFEAQFRLGESHGYGSAGILDVEFHLLTRVGFVQRGEGGE